MSPVKHKYLVVIAGPTAIGKTETSIKIAMQYQADIISADSRQFYREMNIGTAKPSKQDLERVNHHFVNNLSILEDYSAGEYEKEVLKFLDNYFELRNVAIMTGGSGMFIDAVCYGFDETPRDLVIRRELNIEFESKGLSPLLQELKNADPLHFSRVDQSNPQRVIRALEVHRSSGKPFSSFHNKTKKPRSFKIIYIVLDTDRESLYQQIDQRVDYLIKQGWLEEAHSLYKYKDLNSLNTVGYKELFDFIENKYSWEECQEEIKKNTRNYAKRQLTWFRRNDNAKWINVNDKEKLFDYIEKSMSQ